jgi:hypothetical protein
VRASSWSASTRLDHLALHDLAQRLPGFEQELAQRIPPPGGSGDDAEVEDHLDVASLDRHDGALHRLGLAAREACVHRYRRSTPQASWV